ncbi:MAG: hypothetical protein ACRDIY_14670 [Chloroflexota bacterium]
MAHVPIDDAKELFKDTNPKTWSQLHKVLEGHRGKAEGISDNLVDLMIPMSEHFDHAGESFPTSPEKLQELMNHRLAATGHRGTP